MCYLLDRMFPGREFIRNGYYSFLRSPKNQPMQLDMYFPQLKLAFEYQGEQHTAYNSFFHRTRSRFNYLKQCDAIKRQQCAERGITIIYINHNDNLSYDLIRQKIKEAGRGDALCPS